MEPDEQVRVRGRIAAIIRRQDGAIGLEQARAAGLSTAAIRRRVAAGTWARCGPRVFQALDHQITPKATTIAAMLSVGEHATLVGVSAAWWWQLHPVAPAPVQVAVDRSHQPRARVGVHVRRASVAPEDRTVVAGVAVTKRAPTVLDAAVRLGLQDGAELMDRALQRGRVTLEQLSSAHHRTVGREGARAAGTLLTLAAGGARSEAERITHTTLRAAAVRGWAPNVAIDLPGFGTAVGDVVFAAEKVVLEVDGWAYHRDLRAFLLDGPRQSALVAAGWVVLRTHWHQLVDDPSALVSTVRRTLAERRSSPR